MPTFKAVVFTHYTRADKTYNIRIRVTHERKSRYIDTKLVAVASDLTKKLKIKNEAFIDETNRIISGYREKVNGSISKVMAMDVDQLVSFLKDDGKDALDFISFGTRHAEKIEAEKIGGDDRTRTAQSYNTAINALKRYIGGDYLDVSNITVKFLIDFEAWIRANPKNPDNPTPMTRAPSHYMESIRALHNEMKRQYNDEEAGVIRIPLSPFSRYRVPVRPVTKKRALPAEIIRKIAELPDRKVKNSKGTNRFNLGKDCFILSFCLLGINSADLYDCSEMRDGYLICYRKKTRNRRKDRAEIHIKIQPEIEILMDKYRDPDRKRIFRFYKDYSTESNLNKAINKGLKQVGELEDINIEDLQFYAARHSLASIARNKAGIDKYTVDEMLDHVDPAMKTADIYLEKDWGIINNANRKVLDLVFKSESINGISNGK